VVTRTISSEARKMKPGTFNDYPFGEYGLVAGSAQHRKMKI
jgi:hypothetical protein